MNNKIKILTNIILMLNIINSISQEYETLFLKPGPGAGKDVLIRSVYPTINEGDHFDFMSMAGTISSHPFVNRSLIEFDFSDIPDQSIIIEAKLSLYYSEQTGGPGHQGENESYLFKITEEWNESTVTWNTQPSISLNNPVYLPTSTNQFQDYLDIDVTEMITELYNYPDLYHGFMIRLINEEPYRTMTFSSSDQNNPTRWPELEIIYTCEHPDANFSYEIDDELNVTFSNLSTNYDSCFWNFGNGFFSNLVNPLINYQEEGIYLASLTVFNECGQNTVTDTVFCCYDLEPMFSYEISDKVVTFTNESINASSYLWDFGDGFFSFAENPVYTFLEYSDYYVCLTAKNGCFENTHCDSIFIESQGIKDLWLTNVIVTPNPFDKFIQISNQAAGEYSSLKISISDSKGIVLLSAKMEYPLDSELIVDTSKIGTGLYTIILQSEEKIFIQKLIKYTK